MLNQFLTKRYAKDYTCSHFAAELFEHLTGHDMSFMNLHGDMAMRGNLQLIAEPDEEPLLVMMFRGNVAPHAGVLTRGRVWHLPFKQLARADQLWLIKEQFQRIKFYRPK